VLPVIGRRALQPAGAPATLTPEFLTPSQLHDPEGKEKPAQIATIRYGEPVTLSLPSDAGRGIIVHRALELLCQGVSAETARAAIGIPVADADWAALQATAKRFLETLSARFQPAALHWEVPITAADQAGSVISGTIDLLLETGAGCWIVDHKSDETEDRENRFAVHWPQLDCYRKAVAEGLGLSVAGVAIHWVVYGEIGYTRDVG
jgi:ATP-dependent exoDNAse (exonuclease V) beta subunit